MRTFHVEIVKPSHYDKDGYVIQWWKAWIPSNSMACLYGIAQDCGVRKVLGDDVAIARDAVQAGHGVRRNPRLPPLDDVAVLVVVRRLDDLDVKGPHRQPPCSWASAGYTAKALLPQ